MIPFDFAYYRPESLQQAINVYQEYETRGQQAMYYAGGSEIITMCRVGNIHPKAVIDIKNIPECKVLYQDNDYLHIGSVCTLHQISKSNLFPLLKLCCGRIADHTNQCRITIGGNICGSIIYRETCLALLLCDAEITIFGKDGFRRVRFDSAFHQTLQLQSGELLVSIHIPTWALTARHAHLKKTTNEKIDYPLLTAAALWKDSQIRIAFSGLYDYPVRSVEIENALNNSSLLVPQRIQEAIRCAGQVRNDVEASAPYRLFVLQHTLEEMMEG